MIGEKIKINIKPMSVNVAWKGKRYKSDRYKGYEKALLFMLPKSDPIEGKIKISYTFGFSTSLADIDNPVKSVQDILCKKYHFDDRDIYEISVKKEIVKKGKEFIQFEISSL